MTRAGTVVLPNGWSLKPAGRQTGLGDLPVQISLHPTEPILAVLHAGYGEHEIITVDAKTGKVIARVALPASFAGLVWSADGKRLFAGAGFDDRVYRFDHADGLLSRKKVFDYPDRAAFLAAPNPPFGEVAKKSQRVPAGLALFERWQDALRRRGVRPFAGAVRRRIGSVQRRNRARAGRLSLWAWRSMTRASRSM